MNRTLTWEIREEIERIVTDLEARTELDPIEYRRLQRLRDLISSP